MCSGGGGGLIRVVEVCNSCSESGRENRTNTRIKKVLPSNAEGLFEMGNNNVVASWYDSLSNPLDAEV